MHELLANRDHPILIAVTDPDLSLEESFVALADATRGGADVVAIRRFGDDPASLRARVRSLRDEIPARTRIIVRAEHDAALTDIADGVWIASDMPLPSRPNIVVLRSVHGPRGLDDLNGVDAVIYGHVFETASHPGEPARGLTALADVCQRSPVPVIAIGGITAANAAQAIAHGAAGVAVIRAISRAADPASAATAIGTAMQNSMKGSKMSEKSNEERHPNEYGGLSCSLLTISTYLAQRQIKPETVAVAVNDEVIPRDLWDEYNLGEDDTVEVVRAVSGGDHDTLSIAGHEFTSRLFVGTGKYPDDQSMAASLNASGTEMVTVAIRIMNLDGDEPSILESIDLSRYKLLPNTAGAYTVKDAVKMAKLAREATGTNWIKLEVIGDQRSLWPDVAGTIEATKILVADGFVVLPYTSPDLVAALRLQEAGAATVMPLASPIGSGAGMQDWKSIERIVEAVDVPVVVDAGIGVPSDAALALELGADAVLVNTAIAKAQDPVAMARAMRLGVEAGRIARIAGRMPVTKYANPSSPVGGVPTAIE